MGKSRKSKANVTASSKLTAEEQEKQRFEEAQQILNTANVVTCIKNVEELVVYNEARVDFDNLAEHGFDIRDQVDLQGWSGYFNRLCGPIYYKLVVEFWKNAVCNDYYVVSHVLDRKIVISEESIAKLLGMEFQQGKRIKNVDANVPGMRKLVNKAIYDNWSLEKTKYTIKELKPTMKIWQKIFIYCIHPRTGGTDYLNATQKVIMYYISKGEPVCLPFLLFNYLKECVEKSRTTAIETKRSKGDPITLEEFIKSLPDSPPEVPTRKSKRTTSSKPSDPKGKGILIEETKKMKAASKSVVIREPIPEPSPERTPVESPQKSQSDSSESSMASSIGTQEEEDDTNRGGAVHSNSEEVSPRRDVKRKTVMEESSGEETEDDDVPLAKRQRIQAIQVEEDLEQDDCEIIGNVLQVIRESPEAEESTDSDEAPIAKRKKLALKGPLQKKGPEPKQTSEIIPEQPVPISTSLPTSIQTVPPQTEPHTQIISQTETQAPHLNIQTATISIPSIPIQTSSTSTTTESVPLFNSFIKGIVQSEATLRDLVQQFTPKPPSTSRTLLITESGEIPAEKDVGDEDVQILEPPFNVQPIQQVASYFEDLLQDAAAESSYVSLSHYSTVNSRDLSFTSPEKTATSRKRQVTISEVEHMDESDHSGLEKVHVNESAPSGQIRTESSNASSSNATNTPQPIMDLAPSFRPQNLIQLIQEFSDEATRRLQWLYQVTDNQFDASLVDGMWSAFRRWSESRASEIEKQLSREKRLRVHDASERAYEQRQRVLHKVCEPMRRAMAARTHVVSERTSEDADMIPAEVAEDSVEEIIIHEAAEVDEVQMELPTEAAAEVQAPTDVPIQAPEPAPHPEVALLATRIDRIQDDQQRLFQMVEHQGLILSEQSRQIQESSSRMENMMKYLIENLSSSSKP
ncbi:uncharacterized protein LOC130744398 [Lotus japonicus]|uniref:uncharacterized protein LOC130744398 n=1 Tax=Lotus japonicus TaxID=34305 RepID=UPI002591216D|nr:uncharacterized protein LOC130744398 [Lotus japonicus]